MPVSTWLYDSGGAWKYDFYGFWYISDITPSWCMEFSSEFILISYLVNKCLKHLLLLDIFVLDAQLVWVGACTLDKHKLALL